MKPFQRALTVSVVFLTVLMMGIARSAPGGDGRAAKLAALKKQWGMTMSKPLRLGELLANTRKVQRGQKFELTFDLDATFDNPFDPDQIDVTCRFETPDGRALTVPAFFYVPYSRDEKGRIAGHGKPAWKVRFTPRKTGIYRYRVTARDRTGKEQSREGRMECTAGEYKGFVRVSDDNRFYLEFDSGEPYLPVGINLFSWARLGQQIPRDRLPALETYMKRLAEHGGNFIRLRMDSWWLAIEMTPDPVSGFPGPGYYHPFACYEVDQIYEAAERHGIHVMHCMWNANGTVDQPPGGQSNRPWRAKYNYYVKENGGPCGTSEEFWTHPEAAELVRQKLRYCVARWGYSRNLMSWEFFNEVATPDDRVERIADWHARMSRYLKQIDPFNHPVTTSLEGVSAREAGPVWSLPEMDINQRHTYNLASLPAAQRRIVEDAREGFEKAFLFGETGVQGRKTGGFGFDPDGLHLHNELWAPTFAGAAGSGQPWFISNYVDKNDLWHQFEPLTKFVKSIPWNSPHLHQAEVSTPAYGELPEETHRMDLSFPTQSAYMFDVPPEKEFTIHPERPIQNAQMIRPALFCGGSRKAAPRFRVYFPDPGQFIIHVNMSVGQDKNKLLVRVDGELKAEKAFPAGEKYGKGSEYVAQWDNWKTRYDKDVVVEIPAGWHTIEPEATGKDRLEVNYRIPSYRVLEKSDPIESHGVATEDGAWLWFHNRQSIWTTLHQGGEIPGLAAGMTCSVKGLKDGDYRVEWWDTWGGGVKSTKRVKSRKGTLTLQLPGVRHDVACRVRRMGE